MNSEDSHTLGGMTRRVRKSQDLWYENWIGSRQRPAQRDRRRTHLILWSSRYWRWSACLSHSRPSALSGHTSFVYGRWWYEQLVDKDCAGNSWWTMIGWRKVRRLYKCRKFCTGTASKFRSHFGGRVGAFGKVRWIHVQLLTCSNFWLRYQSPPSQSNLFCFYPTSLTHQTVDNFHLVISRYDG